ncbi:INVS [Mytilus edulis]|uniref:INVS n=1 Tax=Mytilus edulis TaxID=6550 RepID=A0A8S3SWV2_MYTED|nr:INVS [Mytilus edulis]
MSQHILRSLLKYGKASFLKDRVQFLSLNGHPPKLTIMIPAVLEKAYFDRILIDIKQGLFLDVITDIQNAFPQFRKAFTSYMKTIIKWNDLKHSGDGSTVVHAVSLEGYDDYLTYFLDLDKSLVNKDNRSGQIPLHLACLKGHSHTAQLLLEKGAFIDKTDENENTPLDLACAGGHKDTADVNLADNKGRTPIFLACEKKQKEIAELLLKCNANTFIDNEEGKRPIHCCCEVGSSEITALLLSHGVDKNQRDSHKSTPLHWACKKVMS